MFYFITLGLVFGSYLNVYITRSLRHETSIMGRSRCDHCHHTIKCYDLIPLISYFLLKGRCRFCHHKIAFQNPLTEFMNMLLWICAYHCVNSKFVMMICLIFSLFLVISIIDLQTMIIPDDLLLFYFICTLFIIFLDDSKLYLHIVGALVMFLLFYSVYFFTKGEGIGGGDVKFMVVSGLLLGRQSVWIALFIASITAFVIEGIIRRKQNVKIAFAPYLCFGVMMAILYSM